MTIRPATLEDVPDLLRMGQRFLYESEYRDRLAYNPAQMRETIEQMIAADHTAVFVYVPNGHVAGMLGVMAFMHPLSGETFASEMFWWVNPEDRGGGVRLLRAAETWARERGAVQMQMIAPNSQVEDLYERLGYQAAERTYQKAI